MSRWIAALCAGALSGASLTAMAAGLPDKVGAEATVGLTTGMVGVAMKGTSWAEALQQAKLRLLDKADTAHPLFWGAFSLVGGG